jgi:predicted dehydrogenase
LSIAWPETEVYENHREMLAKEGERLDGVIIATPELHHASITNECLSQGQAVYCKAPMAMSIDEAAGVVRRARQTGALLQIGLQRRSNWFYLSRSR